MRLLTNCLYPHQSTQNHFVPFTWYQGQGDNHSQGGALVCNPDEDFLVFLERAKAQGSFDAVLFYFFENCEIPKNLHNCPYPLYAVVSDWNLYYFALKHSLAFFDAVFCDKRGAQLLQRNGIPAYYWNPYRFGLDRFAAVPPQPKKYDIVFIGNLAPHIQRARAQFIRRLVNMPGAYNIHIATDVRGQEYLETCAQAKILFNRSIRGEANIRFFESMGCKSLTLMERSNQEAAGFLTPGVECVLYNDNDLEQVLEYWITQDQERETVVENAQQKACTLNFTHSIDELCDLISKIQSEAKEPNAANLANNSRQRRCHQWAPLQIEQQRFIKLLLTPIRNDKNRYWQKELEALINSGDRRYTLGLYIMFCTFQYKDKPMPSDAWDNMVQLFSVFKKEPQGQIWNYFNFILLCKQQRATELFLQTCTELIALLQTDSLPQQAWDGVPALRNHEEMLMELNFFSWSAPAIQSQEPQYTITQIVLHIVHAWLGDYYLNTKHHQQALEYFLTALDYYPLNDNTLFSTALAAVPISPNHAAIYAEKAYLASPVIARYWQTLLRLLKATNQQTKAQKYYAEMQKLEPVLRSWKSVNKALLEEYKREKITDW
jgi:tetratricopeptide (TPR) repeat protein